MSPRCEKFIVVVAMTLVFSGSLVLRALNAQSLSPALLEPADAELPNLLRINDQLYSGGQPHSEAAFQELHKMGIKTIISVDGVRPNLELATKYQLRYAHLPHGYDQISVQHRTLLAQCVHQLEKPIYIHCHHGKHRSPAAAAVASVGMGWLTNESARSILVLAQTDQRYQGLFRSVDQANALSTNQLNAEGIEFPEVAKLPAIVTSMVEIEKLFESLQQYQQDHWQFSGKSLIEAVQAGTLLHEQFRELSRLDVPRRTDLFQECATQSQISAEQIERILTKANPSAAELSRLDEAMFKIRNNCVRCHQAYRN